jgi:hypothetical protein
VETQRAPLRGRSDLELPQLKRLKVDRKIQTETGGLTLTYELTAEVNSLREELSRAVTEQTLLDTLNRSLTSRIRHLESKTLRSLRSSA